MQLSNIQRLYIQTIFDYLHEQGTWPNYGFVERKISQIHHDFHMRGVASSLPDGFGNAFAFNFNRNQEAVLGISAVRLCKGSEDELADFVRALQYCVDKYFSFVENNLQVTSDEIKVQLKISELSVCKVGKLIGAEAMFWSSLGRNANEGSWTCTLTPGMDGIAFFYGVNSIEKYLEKLNQRGKTLETSFRNPSGVERPYPIVEQFQEVNKSTMNSESTGRDRVKIFFCYAHEDEAHFKKLKTHLSPLQRQGLIYLWHDRDISAGTEWEREIDKHLGTADIILLLISSDFISSEYCYGTEMKKALGRHERGEACVIPIILRTCYWQLAGIDKLQALPTDAMPVMSSKWHNVDDAFFNIVEGIRKVAERLVARPLLSSEKVSLNVPSLKTTRETEATTLNFKIQEGNDQKTLYQLFFAELLERLKTARPGITTAKKTYRESFWFFGAGKTGYTFEWAFTEEGLRTKLIINVQDRPDITKKAFDILYEQQLDIEQEFGQSLIWKRRPEGKESHIYLIKPATITDPLEKLEQTKIWALETMLKFVDVFQKRIKVL